MLFPVCLLVDLLIKRLLSKVNTPDWLDIQVDEIEPYLFDRISDANMTNDLYNDLQQAIVDLVPKLHRVKISRC